MQYTYTGSNLCMCTLSMNYTDVQNLAQKKGLCSIYILYTGCSKKHKKNTFNPERGKKKKCLKKCVHCLVRPWITGALSVCVRINTVLILPFQYQNQSKGVRGRSTCFVYTLQILKNIHKLYLPSISSILVYSVKKVFFGHFCCEVKFFFKVLDRIFLSETSYGIFFSQTLHL